LIAYPARVLLDSLYQINDAMFPIQLDKTFLDFGVDSHKQCPINTVLGDVLVRTIASFFCFVLSAS
jgi:hypothetical protein